MAEASDDGFHAARNVPMTGPGEGAPVSGWCRSADGRLLCPACHAQEVSIGEVEAEPAEAGECDACGRTSDDLEELLSDEQLQRLAAGMMTADEMFSILFGLGGHHLMSGPPARRPGLSKTRFVSGWQCHNRLWWQVHEPDAPELVVGTVLRDLFDQGQQVGALARDQFPGGVLIDLPHDAVRQRLAKTESALRQGVPAIFEASFAQDGVLVTVDVLQRDGEGYTLIEVKSSTMLKDEHIPDAAVQTHVVRASGLDVRRIELMHLNSDYRHPEEGDLFLREDITASVQDILQGVPLEIESQLAMLAGDFPALPVGGQCLTVQDCPFRRRCWPDDRDHVLKLSGKGLRKALELMSEGIHYIPDVPEDNLTAVNRRQKIALERNGLVVEPGLGDALQGIRHPIGFLDFETVSRAVPVWDGLAPWGTVPVQFSYHEKTLGGACRHTEWLAEGGSDPREALAAALVEACRNAGSIMTYTHFERTQIRHLARAVPALTEGLKSIEDRLFDLHRAVKDHLYHPDFDGSFSIKNVLPVLVPELGWNDLEIAEGQTASVEIARMLLRPETFRKGEREALRRKLLAYCERDTWAMVRLLQRLEEISKLSGR